jgi:catechol-2,3-dioxygenase
VKISKLGHIVLRVRDAEKSAAWYVKILGLKETYRMSNMVFLSCSDESSHEIALMSLGEDADGPDHRKVGMYHIGWQLDSLGELKGLRGRLEEQGVEVVGVGDHGISLGIYVLDLDGNELEFFYELPKTEWPTDGNLFSGRFPLNIDI